MVKWISWNSHNIESLGLDINSKNIELLLLTKTDQGYAIKQSICIPIEKNKADSFEEAAIKAIKKAIVQLKTHNRKVNIAIPDVTALSHSFVLDTTVPDWQKAALLRLAPDIPVPLDKVYLEFEAKYPDATQVLGVTCLRDDIDKRLKLIQEAGLEPQIVELESHAIERTVRYFNMMQAHAIPNACIYLTMDTVIILFWIKKTIIATSSDHLTHINQSVAIVRKIHQQLSHLLFTSSAQPLKTIYMIGNHPLKLEIAGISQRQLGLNLYLCKPKIFNQNSSKVVEPSLVAFGLALRNFPIHE